MNVSVITVTHNHEQTIDLLMDSLWKNKAYIKEWCVTDDGSTDRTVGHILTHSMPFPIHLSFQEHKGMRLSKAINECCRHASADLLFIIMGDSYMEPDTLKLLDRDYLPDSAGSGNRNQVDHKGNIISFENRKYPSYDDVVSLPEAPWKYLTGNSMIVRREDLQKIGGWDEQYEGYGADDLDVFRRLFFAHVPLFQYNTVKINHVQHPAQTEDTQNVTRFRNALIESL